jgi:hypothetical protein
MIRKPSGVTTCNRDIFLAKRFLARIKGIFLDVDTGLSDEPRATKPSGDDANGLGAVEQVLELAGRQGIDLPRRTAQGRTLGRVAALDAAGARFASLGR